MPKQDNNITLLPTAQTQIRETDALPDCVFSRHSRPDNIVEFKPTDGVIRVFKIVTKGPTNEGNLHDFSAYKTNRAA